MTVPKHVVTSFMLPIVWRSRFSNWPILGASSLVLACMGEPFSIGAVASGASGSGGSSAIRGGADQGHTGEAAPAGGSRSAGVAGSPLGGDGGGTAQQPGDAGGAGAPEGGVPNEPVPSCGEAATGDLELRYFPELRAAEVQEAHPFFQLVPQEAAAPLLLSQIKIRYYFTNEFREDERATCYWVTGDRCALVEARFYDLLDPTGDAGRYLELTFPQGGDVTVLDDFEVRVGFRAGAMTLRQTNDYSFDPEARAPTRDVEFPYKTWRKATVYVNDKLVWGREPCGAATLTALP